MRRNSFVLAVVSALTLVLAGCHRSSTAPSEDCTTPDGRHFACNPNWPFPGSPPTSSPTSINFTSSDGKVTFTFTQNTPAIPNGTARVGDMGQIWSTVTNRGASDILVFQSIVDAPDVNPMHPGRDSRIFQSSKTIKSGQNDITWGFIILPDAESSIPYLRFLAYDGYEAYSRGRAPIWYKDIHLGWTINR